MTLKGTRAAIRGTYAHTHTQMRTYTVCGISHSIRYHLGRQPSIFNGIVSYFILNDMQTYSIPDARYTDIVGGTSVCVYLAGRQMYLDLPMAFVCPTITIDVTASSSKGSSSGN